MKKVCILLLTVSVLALGIVTSAVSVSAAGEGQEIAYTAKEKNEVIADFTDMTKVTGTWDNNKERVFDGNKLVISNDVCGNITGLKVTGVEPGVYKVGYFMEIKAIKDSDNPPEEVSGMQDWRFRVNPFGVYVNMPYYPCTFDVHEFDGLSTVVGQKIIAIAVINVEETSDIELVSWPKDGYMDATLDRIVFAGADYDFGPANHPDYTIFYEDAAHEAPAEKIPDEDDWTASKLKLPSTEPTKAPTAEPTDDTTEEPTEEPTATPEQTSATVVTTPPATSTASATATSSSTQGANDGDATMIIVIVVVVVVIVAAVAIFMVMKKKKG